MAKKLGERLVEAGLVTADSVDKALKHQRITGHRLGDCLVETGLLDESALLRFLATEFNTRYVSSEKLSKAKVPTEVLDKVPVRMAEEQIVLPLAMDSERKILSVVMAEPQNETLVKEIALVAEMAEVYPYVGLRSVILAGIKRFYYGDPGAFSVLRQGVGANREATAARSPDSASLPGVSVVTDPEGRRTGTRGSHEGTSASRVLTSFRDSLGVGRGAVSDVDYVESLGVLVGLLEQGRGEMRGHSAALTRQAVTIARRIGLQPREVQQVAMASQLHDVAKPTDRHFTLAALAQNPDWRGDAKKALRAPVRLFESVHLPSAVNLMLAQLYEAFDGTGLPQGTRGDDIHAGARIISAVDSFLDLTRNPANAQGRLLGQKEALAHLTSEAGKLFDPLVVDWIHRLHSGELLRQRVEADGRQVLVAHPDEAVRTDLTEALEHLGLAVHTVSRLDGCAEALLSGEGDVLVVGLHFGVAEVLSVVQFLRTQPESAAIPVVVVGQPGDSQTKDRLVSGGVDLLIPLPFEPDEAGRAIAEQYAGRVQHGGPGHEVAGSFEEIPPGDLLRLLARGKKSGRLLVRNNAQEGQLFLERGRGVFATFMGQGGEAALKAMLTLPRADFVYEPEGLLVELPQLDKDLEVIARDLERAGAAPT